jgi:hypothetical protein
MKHITSFCQVVGLVLERGRRAVELSRSAAAAHMKIAESTLERMEKGDSKLDLVQLERFCAATGMTSMHFLAQVNRAVDSLQRTYDDLEIVDVRVRQEDVEAVVLGRTLLRRALGSAAAARTLLVIDPMERQAGWLMELDGGYTEPVYVDDDMPGRGDEVLPSLDGAFAAVILDGRLEAVVPSTWVEYATPRVGPEHGSLSQVLNWCQVHQDVGTGELSEDDQAFIAGLPDWPVSDAGVPLTTAAARLAARSPVSVEGSDG